MISVHRHGVCIYILVDLRDLINFYLKKKNIVASFLDYIFTVSIQRETDETIKQMNKRFVNVRQ